MIFRLKASKTDTRTHWASEDSIMMLTNILLKWEADQALDIHFYRKKRDKNCKACNEFSNPLQHEQIFLILNCSLAEKTKHLASHLKSFKHSNAECGNGGLRAVFTD